LKRFFLDVNAVLDVFLDRAPFAGATRDLWAAAERQEIEVIVPAHGVTTVFYVASRERDSSFARRVVSDLLIVPKVAPVDLGVLRRALAFAWPDFEDAVCAAAAETARCDVLVTRDPKGFPDSPVLVMDPPTALSLLDHGKGPGQVSERATVTYARRKKRGRQR